MYYTNRYVMYGKSNAELSARLPLYVRMRVTDAQSQHSSLVQVVLEAVRQTLAQVLIGDVLG